MRRVIKIHENVVISTKEVFEDYKLADDELYSLEGDSGQILKPDGTFVASTVDGIKTETLEEKIDRIERQLQQDNITSFEVLATIYEELLMKG